MAILPGRPMDYTPSGDVIAATIRPAGSGGQADALQREDGWECERQRVTFDFQPSAVAMGRL